MWGALFGVGMTVADLFMRNRAQRRAAEVDDRSQREAERAALVREKALADALAFSKQQYEDQTRREEARWNAYETRRVPYRQASLDSLGELRKLIGI